MAVYNELRLEQQLCDAVIRVDNVEFHVHKIILCNCSSYFKELFTHWSTPDSRDFDIPNVTADMMKLIIDFAYTDSVLVTQDNVQELFVAADQFNVMGIVKVCCSFLEGQLSPQNCIGIWWFTGFHYTPETNHKAFLFMLNHFEEIAATSEEFLLLSAGDLVKIIEKDQLNVKQEETVFEAVLRWIAHENEERREYIPLLLSNIRLALMNPDYLKDCVRNNDLAKASKKCRLMLDRTMKAVLHQQSGLVRPRLPPAILFAVGGWSGGSPTNAIEAYDVRADLWVDVTNNEEAPRAYHGLVFLNSSVYCVGGFDSVALFSSVHRFDLDTHSWHEVSQMHMSRCYVSVTVLDGCIYAMGGYDGHERLRTAERYQPAINQWTLIATMHEQRSDASCTTLHGKVYICGGFTGNECLSSAECYDPETDQWTLIASMGNRRSGIGVITYADHIFAVGGFSGTSRLQTAEKYNPHTDTWDDVPSMLSPRSNFGIAVLDDCLFVVGGFNGLSTTHDVECFDAKTGEWSAVCDMAITRSALSCCVVYGLTNLAEYAARHPSPQLSTGEDDDVE
ncbi:kelch-like protein 10 [Sebastes umbrosus]|uniref:kelch-like protein 10 n=1 Tax=Sebastes umbrosus TaxID=72105 RepID=UPI00189D58D0|nr:kelch-like protein 10 [Sebastes umbrosus]